MQNVPNSTKRNQSVPNSTKKCKMSQIAQKNAKSTPLRKFDVNKVPKDASSKCIYS